MSLGSASSGLNINPSLWATLKCSFIKKVYQFELIKLNSSQTILGIDSSDQLILMLNV